MPPPPQSPVIQHAAIFMGRTLDPAVATLGPISRSADERYRPFHACSGRVPSCATRAGEILDWSVGDLYIPVSESKRVGPGGDFRLLSAASGHGNSLRATATA